MRKLLRALMPGTYRRIRQRFGPYGRVLRAVTRQQGLRVASGPFAGMQYLPQARGSRLVPKLLGSYEMELHAGITAEIARRPAVIVDVGCAEGYYAVGFARALPGATVYAYDIDAESRALCARLAALNQVKDRVVVRARCDTRELAALPLHQALVVCDCEGYEIDLLNPAAAPGLLQAHLLVELHDCFVPGITAELTRRFEASHRIRFIDLAPRSPEGWPVLQGLPPSWQTLAVYERDTDTTPPQQWAHMTPRAEPT